MCLIIINTAALILYEALASSASMVATPLTKLTSSAARYSIILLTMCAITKLYLDKGGSFP